MAGESDRPELPIERGFPIERINEIAEKESRAKQYYRPIYTMHKWWARRPGSVFRAICLYALLDDPEEVSVFEPGENKTLSDFGGGADEIRDLLGNVNQADPESLWDLYPKDVRVEDKKILDPFMGGGTSLVEASRFGAETVGYDLNPVAWFVTKKELEAGRTDVADLEAAFEEVRDDVADDITQYYRTPCPNAAPEEAATEEAPAATEEAPTATEEAPTATEEAPAATEEAPDASDDPLAHGHDHEADVMYNFWVKELDCVSCGHTVPLFKDYRVAKGRYDDDDKYNVLCPDCGDIVLVDDWRSECSCSSCAHEFVPEEGNASGSNYTCPDCGQKYGITDAIQEQGGFDLRLYAVEWYCPTCDENTGSRSESKGYKPVSAFDEALYSEAASVWEQQEGLHQYIPDEKIPEGAITASSSISGNDVFNHGYRFWEDMLNERQKLSLSKLLKKIEGIEDQNVKEYLLLAFSDCLRTNTLMCSYQPSRNHSNHIFKTNSFDPPQQPSEGNVWGAEYGMGTFQSIWNMVISGVEYANAPTERHVKKGETIETDKFAGTIGDKSEVYQGDMRKISSEDEYDAIISDPPYYDNIIYSEVSDFFYVWLKILLEDEYDCFSAEKTPRAESIVTNPYLDKDVEDFESELHHAFSVIRRAVKENGVVAFTYHHSDSESWGELLESLCESGFEVTATYPINSDLHKFIGGEAVSFDIVVIARPVEEREPITWRNLRRNIIKTAQETRADLEENRELKSGDIGVIEMGECYHEYSKHHGEVRRYGEIMDAKDVVDEIYGIIQENSELGEVEVFLSLLGTTSPSYDDVNLECRSANVTPDQLKAKKLFSTADGFSLGTWNDDARQAYIEERVNGTVEESLSALDKAQFLRYRYEHGKTVGNYLQKWRDDDDLRETCESLAEVTDDEGYERLLGGDQSLGSFGDE
ncbi:DUF1156 domain-containing protein [Halorussus salinus]|uniref:DUF1156 domain-containing protein n=1 Tax=Halorussus salinus TaxID=1364935 RepID=UPI001091A082|nr:DUF1156 domain-containing protein [Halorussus salinus]